MSLIQKGPINNAKIESTQQAMAQSPETIEATEQDFMMLIAQTSMQMPVIVVFHKKASPASQKMRTQFENIIRQSDVMLQLASFDIDSSAVLAAQLQIETVPTVMAFYQGQPVDGFAGPQDDNFIRQFLGKLAGKEIVNPEEMIKDAVDAAMQALDENRFDDAASTAEQILQAVPDSTKALAIFIRAQAGLRGADFAMSIIEQLNEDQRKDPDIIAAVKRIELSKNAASDDELQSLKAAYLQNPDDLAIVQQFAEALMTKDAYEEAIELWLEMFKKDSNFAEGIAKIKLLEIFEILGGEDARVIEGRKKLATLLW